MKKLIKFIGPHINTILRLLPRALVFALALMWIYIWLVRSYNPVDELPWGVRIAAYFLSLVGFYVSHFTSNGIKNWLYKEENEL